MTPEKAYLIGCLGGYGTASMLLAAILTGCSTGKNACEPQPTHYKVPQVHVEMQARMMAAQRQLIISNKTDESTDD